MDKSEGRLCFWHISIHSLTLSRRLDVFNLTHDTKKDSHEGIISPFPVHPVSRDLTADWRGVEDLESVCGCTRNRPTVKDHSSLTADAKTIHAAGFIPPEVISRAIDQQGFRNYFQTLAEVAHNSSLQFSSGELFSSMQIVQATDGKMFIISTFSLSAWCMMDSVFFLFRLNIK